MTWNLFLDDERTPEDVKWAPRPVHEKYRNEDWIVARNYADAMIEVLGRGFPKYISFDHDLGQNEKTGYDLAKSLVNKDLQGVIGYGFSGDFQYYVHSKNPIGKANIEGLLESYFKHKD